MAERLKLTDRKLQSLKPAAAGTRVEIFDALVPALMVRVTDTGHRSFALYIRVPNADGSRTPARLAVGTYPATTLDKAREKARDWLELIDRGKDPRKELAAERQEEQRRRAGSFGAVAEDFLRRYGPTIEKRTDLETTIRSDFLCQERKVVDGKTNWVDTREQGWRDKPIGDITRADVVAVIDRIVDRGAKYQAHNALGYIRRLFNWAIGRGVYGLENSPCDRLKPKDVIGKRAVRKRVLTDVELRAVWSAALEMGYPFGDVFRMLMLTGQRASDVAEAVRPEFDLGKALWEIPPARMKMDVGHIVPLAPAVVEMLESLPRFNGGSFVFSTTNGSRPISGFSKAKARLDELVLRNLQCEVEQRGDDPQLVKLDHFVLHDLRRTARTRFSGIPSEDVVRELTIAHKPKGLHDVYDQWKYVDEKRALLGAWAAQLKGIVEAKPANVATLSEEKAKRADVKVS